MFGSANHSWKTFESSIPVLVVAPGTGMRLRRTFTRADSFSNVVTLGFASNSEPEYTYDIASGTSMAAPHVAAAAALVWSHFPDCTNEQIRYALAASAKDMGEPGCDTESGYGIVQAKAAYEFLESMSCSSGDWPTSVSTGGCSTVP